MCSIHSQDMRSNEQMNTPLENPFWQFSLYLYAKPEAEVFCLKLQDQHHMQVNLLLYSIWLSFEGCILEPLLIKQNSQLQNWLNEIIPSIRNARKCLGENSKQDPLYKQLKACELDAEQKAQALIFNIKRTSHEGLPPTRQADLNNFESLLNFNLNLCWQAFSSSNVKIQQPELINEFSEWMIIHCQRKIAGKFKH